MEHNMEIAGKIINIIANQAKKDKASIASETTFDDLGLDSLDEAEIIMDIEEEFSIEFPEDVAIKIKNVGELCDSVEGLVKK